ncbi:Uncharacterized protein ACO02O_04293 [Dirofilaria immitis]
MGCRFSKMNDAAESEVDSDSTDVAATEILNHPLLGVTEYLLDSESVVTSTNMTKSLNPITVSDEVSVRGEDRTTSIDNIKNDYSMAQWDVPIRSSFSERVISRSKTLSSDSQMRESTDVSINKPIKQIESASQADFFRMLDEKIAQGSNDLIDSDAEK